MVEGLLPSISPLSSSTTTSIAFVPGIDGSAISATADLAHILCGENYVRHHQGEMVSFIVTMAVPGNLTVFVAVSRVRNADADLA